MTSIFVAFFLMNVSSATENTPSIIRLAVFDNPKPDPSQNENMRQFEDSYIAGIDTAIAEALKKGIRINKKNFFHSSNLASMIQEASNVKAWKADVIVGLSTSNDFLMSKAFFQDQVILSISATDRDILNLPPGFYSLGIPDTDAVNIIIKLIHKYYPNSDLFITATAESKESVDFADLLAEVYKKKYHDVKTVEKKFLTDDMVNMDLSKFMAGYKKNDVIVVMSIGYDSAITLMNKISAYLDPARPVFVTSTDNWGNNKTPSNMTGSYDAFRIDTLSGSEYTKSYKEFLENFKHIYHRPPENKISFVTYQTIMSFVDALKKYPSNNGYINKKTILLNSYLKALSHHPNWYRPPYYVVYKLENQKETYFDKIN